jgi:hypothetical protein
MIDIECENSDVQFRYGLLFWCGEDGPIDFRAALHCVKLSPEQGDLNGQFFIMSFFLMVQAFHKI